MPTTDEATRVLFERIQAEMVAKDLKRFVRVAWPQVETDPFVEGWHIDMICDHLEALLRGEIRNLIICIPPRMSKSTIVSVLFPVWVWLSHPEKKFLCTSYAQTLSVRDAVKSRSLINSPWFQRLYGDRFKLTGDMNLKTRYNNDAKGYRLSTSVDGTGIGEGGDIIIGDDIHNLAEIYSDVSRQNAVDYWQGIIRTRLNDPATGQKILIMQRGHPLDVVGAILKTEGDRWTKLFLPMEYDPARPCETKWGKDPRTKPNDLICPQRYPPDEVKALKDGMTEIDFAAQFNQQPLFERGNIIKRSWWKLWDDKRETPTFDMVIQSYDTAFEEEEVNDYSARTTWGLFKMPCGNGKFEMHALLLERWKKRVVYPDLRAEAIRSCKQYQPDWIIVEKRASGHSLIQDLKRSNLSVKAVPKNVDKIAAAHLASLVCEKGRVWYPKRKWANEVVDEVTAFPMGDHDDLADTVFMAWAWMRRMGDMLFVDESDDHVDLYRDARRA